VSRALVLTAAVVSGLCGYSEVRDEAVEAVDIWVFSVMY
jgi:hypothetical protein